MDTLEGADPDRIADELFSSAIEEVVEETGIARRELTDALFLGVVRRTQHHRPVSIFATHTTLSADEAVERCLSDAAVDRYESLSTVALPLAQVQHMAERYKMPGCQSGGVALLYRHLVQSKRCSGP